MSTEQNLPVAQEVYSASANGIHTLTQDEYERILNDIIDLKLQHNALVRTTSKQGDHLMTTIPGINIVDAIWKKYYFSRYGHRNPDLYKVSLFEVPSPPSIERGGQNVFETRLLANPENPENIAEPVAVNDILY